MGPCNFCAWISSNTIANKHNEPVFHTHTQKIKIKRNSFAL